MPPLSDLESAELIMLDLEMADAIECEMCKKAPAEFASATRCCNAEVLWCGPCLEAARERFRKHVTETKTKRMICAECRWTGVALTYDDYVKVVPL